MNSTSRRLAACLLLTFIGLNGSAQAGPLEDARQLADAKNYAKALETIEGVLKETPKEPRARFLKGVILAENRQNTEAIAVFNDLTQDYRELPEPYNNLAVLYAEQGEFERAREALLHAIRTHPSYATAHENLGDIYARLASEAYIKALQINRGNNVAQTKLNLIREIFNTPVAPKGKTITVAQVQPQTQAPTPPQAKVPPAESPVREPPVTTPEVEPKKSAPPPVDVAPKPVEKAPAPAPVPADDTAQSVNEATRAVLDWAKSWSSKDSTAYLKHYGKEFSPPRGMSRDEWEKERKTRITKPKYIQVNLSSIRATPVAGNLMEVRFLQEYKSDYYQSRTHKMLQLKQEGKSWKIIQEISTDG